MRNQGASDTGRLETFADGVFAIAITLLVLEIRLPSEQSSLAEALATLWPSYLGFGVSFITIGIMWLNHHNLFKLIDHVDHNFIVLNLLLLMSVAFVPFPTRVLSEHLTSATDKVAANAFYCGTFTVTAVFYNLIWRYASAGRRLLRPTVSDRIVVAINKRWNPGPPIYFATTLLAFVSVPVSLTVTAGLAVLYLLPFRSPFTE